MLQQKYLYGEITSSILECYHFVFRELPGRRWLEEKHVSRVLVSAFRVQPLLVEEQVPVPLKFHHVEMGTGLIDLLVEKKVIVELKNIRKLKEQDKDQLKAYLHYGGYAVGLLLNFGSREPDFLRVENRDAFPDAWRIQ